jgi:predicted DNA-binding transcriptional regulator AlpA
MATAVMTTGILGQLLLAFFAPLLPAPLWVLAEMAQPEKEKRAKPGKRAARSPNRKLIFRKELCEMLHVSAPTVWVWTVRHNFPKPIVVVGRSAWYADEVEAWVASRPRRKSKYDTPQGGDADA